MHNKRATKYRAQTTFERHHIAITVEAGDSLSAIALRETGRASAWVDLYNVSFNRLAIDAAQRAYGTPSEGPHRIYPGMVLWIPRRLLKQTEAA